MATTVIWDAFETASDEQMTVSLDYDDVNQAVGLTIAGRGHAVLTLADNTTVPATPIETIDCNQFHNDGQRHIIAGPGATGTTVNSTPLPTKRVTAAMVARVVPPKGQQPTLIISLDWSP